MRWAGYKNVCFFSSAATNSFNTDCTDAASCVFDVFRLLPGAVHVT